MKKYGVDEVPPDGYKQATAPTVCPKCGQKLIIEGQVKLCPQHGSEPFETPK